jgi:hypothetical protein
MDFLIVIAGLIAGALGAVLMLVSGGSVAGEADADSLARSRRRSRLGLALIGAGLVLLLLGGVVLPLRSRESGIGAGGVLLLVLLTVLALGLDAVGVLLLLLSRVPLGAPADRNEVWFDRARYLTRIGLAALLAGLLAQLASVFVIAR